MNWINKYIKTALAILAYLVVSLSAAAQQAQPQHLQLRNAALALVTRDPAVKTIVLECTNLPVYQSAIEAATGRPTVDLVRMLSGLN